MSAIFFFSEEISASVCVCKPRVVSFLSCIIRDTRPKLETTRCRWIFCGIADFQVHITTCSSAHPLHLYSFIKYVWNAIPLLTQI